MVRGRYAEYDNSKVVESLYRPFTKRWLFFDRVLIERVYRIPVIFSGHEPNFVINCTTEPQIDFSALAADVIPCLHLGGRQGQCFPLSHLSDGATELFRRRYNPGLTKRRIFEYIYGLLHHPGYRDRYAEALKKQLPRIPLAPDFEAFATAGARLMDLHLHYEQQTPHPLEHIEKAPFTWELIGKMKLSKDRHSLVYNDSLTLSGIPDETFEYRLGHRCALDWVIHQYQRKETSNPNRSDDPEYIVRLVKQVITVSLETMVIARALPDFVPRS
jgi:predicted helicase